MKISKLIVLNLSVLLLIACARESGMRINTNTFANKEVIPQGFPKDASFSISTKQKGDAMFTQEVSQKIATILKDKGFAVNPIFGADYNLNFSFGMKKSTHVRDVPIFIPDYGHWYYNHYHYPYGYGYGYSVAYVPEEYTLFNKILLIEVYKNNNPVPVWQGTSHSYETDSDLRDAIDYLLVTVLKHFGKNTKKYIRSKMKDDNEEVEKLRQEYFQPIGHVEK